MTGLPGERSLNVITSNYNELSISKYIYECTLFIRATVLERFKDQRERLNKFFMHFVSEMVFTPETPPDDGILLWLTECVTFRNQTREFSVFYCADVVDPTPVLRSYLLKLFLQYNDERVENHLNQIMKSWKVIEPEIQEHQMTMMIDCYKVSLFESSSR